jgi:hypothetical protein
MPLDLSKQKDKEFWYSIKDLLTDKDFSLSIWDQTKPLARDIIRDLRKLKKLDFDTMYLVLRPLDYRKNLYGLPKLGPPGPVRKPG